MLVAAGASLRGKHANVCRHGTESTRHYAPEGSSGGPKASSRPRDATVGPPPWEKKPLRGRIGSSTLEPVAGWVFTEDFYVLSNRAGTYQGRASSDQH